MNSQTLVNLLRFPEASTHQGAPGKDGAQEEKRPVEQDHFLERWKDSDKNNMGNDISSEVDIANNRGKSEGGSDNRWHMEDHDERVDHDDEIGE